MTDTHTPIEEILDKGRADRDADMPPEPADPQAEHEAKRARDKRGRFANAENEPGPPDDHREPPKQPKQDPKPKEPEKAPEASGTSPAPQKAPTVQPGAQPEGDVPSDPDNTWSYAAYRDEKDKRQKAEQRAQRTEQVLIQTRQQLANLTKQHQAPAIDPIENPQGFVGELQQGFQSEIQKIRLENSLQLAQIRHNEVFDKAYEELIAAAYGGDQASYLRVMNSPNIGEAIVQWHRERTALTEIGNDPDKWREAEREKLRAELHAEMTGEQSSRQPQQQVQQPSNLAGARNVGSRSGPAWPGPASLDDIFDRGRRKATR